MEWHREAAIGISAGNALARVAVFEAGRARMVPLEEGEAAMPSAVLLHRMREVGKYACLYSGTDPNLLVTSLNRLLGRRYQELRDELESMPFTAQDDRGRVRILGQLGDSYSPIELYAMVLRKLKQAAERYLDRTVNCAVLAVPAGFDDFQRRSVLVAAQYVFEDVKLVNEPTAALMVRDGTIASSGHVLTFDMGAGKSEAAVINCGPNFHFRIRAVVGDTHLGGDDIDRAIFDHIAACFAREQGETLVGDSAMARHEVMLAVREAKHRLSVAETAEIVVPFVNFDRAGRPLHLITTIDRALVRNLCMDIFARVGELITRCIRDAHNPRINGIYLLGGSTRLPFFTSLLRRYGNSEPQRQENADELPALGACLYAASLCGQVGNIDLEEVTAHSLGITTYTGQMGFVLKRQTEVPATVTKRFFTVENNQRSVRIDVREGEASQAISNRQIGEFDLPLAPNLPKGSPIDVTIGKSEDGIVLVRARDERSGQAREITITYDL